MKLITIRCQDEYTKKYAEKQITGEPIDLLEGYEFAVHEDYFYYDTWTITELSTGYRLAIGRSKEEVIMKAKTTLELRKNEFIMLVGEVIQKNKTLFA